MTIAIGKFPAISKRSTLGAVHKCLKPDEWDRFYTKAIENLQPGITQITVHLTYDDEEIRAVTIDHSDYDAAWRGRDLDSPPARERRNCWKNDIHLINWRELGKLLQC
jgi:hypothetical protein